MTDEPTTATVPAVTYATMALASIPRRVPPVRVASWDADQAAALLAAVSGDPILVDGKPSAPTATDSLAYADLKAARSAANAAKRLLGHVLPDGKVSKSAIFGLDKKGNAVQQTDSTGSFGFVVWIANAPAPKVEPEAPSE